MVQYVSVWDSGSEYGLVSPMWASWLCVGQYGSVCVSMGQWGGILAKGKYGSLSVNMGQWA